MKIHTVVKVRIRLALIPGGGSNTKMRPALKRLTGSFGLISVVKNSLNPGWGCSECNFFSNCTSQDGAK